MGMTIREIAAIAGVSPAAVSLVINNKKGVSEGDAPPRAQAWWRNVATCPRFRKKRWSGFA